MKKETIFGDLEPTGVLAIFEEILTIPRPSKHEEFMRNYLRSFAAAEQLECREDAKGNIAICKKATTGYDNHPTVVLQGHMDMVCEKLPGVEHDFMKDPIEAYVEDGWVKARGTTLGADCGIGMALQLAVLRDKTIKHPAIEALFTVDEEQGLSGAMELDAKLLRGNYLINLDSEDEGEIFIGCAGGIDTVGRYSAPLDTPIDPTMYIYSIAISGLLGGHSGDDIEKGRACANKLLGWMLYETLRIDNKALLISIDGGNLRNAIARDAVATIAVNNKMAPTVTELLEQIKESFLQQFKPIEHNMTITIEKQVNNGISKAMSPKNGAQIVNALQMLPHGVVEMSRSIPNFVETSTNLASVKQIQNEVVVTTSQRSSVHQSKMAIAATVENIMTLGNAKVKVGEGYPGWTPNPESKLLEICDKTYKKIFSKPPKIKAIHAGLECGLILEKYPKMEAVSIGPTLRNVHSPSEKLDLYTLKQTWIYLVGILESI